MHQKKLCGVLEDLGFSNARGVISSGNVIFESDSGDVKAIQDLIERAWPTKLGFQSTTIIRSQKELQLLAEKNPFKNVEHSQSNYLTVTFFKNQPKLKFKFPYRPEGRAYELLGLDNRAIFSVIDLTSAKTPDLMTWLEKTFGKEITTRTWKTVGRIIKKMEQ